MTSRPLLFAALLAALPALAWAGAPDFSGAWTLDPDASDSMDAVFKLQEVGWHKRLVAEGLDHDVKIEQSATGMRLQFDNLLGEPVMVLVFDGQPHATVNPAGFPATLACSWEAEALVCAGPTQSEEGVPGTMTERRTLSADGQTMTLEVSVALSGAGSAQVKRVFRRG